MKYRTSIAVLILGILLQNFLAGISLMFSSVDFVTSFALVCSLLYGKDKLYQVVIPSLILEFLFGDMGGAFLGKKTIVLGITLLILLFIKPIVNIENIFAFSLSTIIMLAISSFLNTGLSLLEGFDYSVYSIFISTLIYIVENFILTLIIYFVLNTKVRNNKKSRSGYFR